MRELLLTCLFAASAFAQSREVRRLHQFRRRRRLLLSKGPRSSTLLTGSTGSPAPAPTSGARRISSTMSGARCRATLRSPRQPNFSRRETRTERPSSCSARTLDTDSPFVHLAIHGDGMPAVQFRNSKADNTNTVDFPIEGPGTFKLKLVRQGATITVFLAKDGAPLRELGTHRQPVGQPDIGRTRRQLAHAGRDKHGVVFGCVGGAAARRRREGSNNAYRTWLTADLPALRLRRSRRAESLGAFTNSGDVGGPAEKERRSLTPPTGSTGSPGPAPTSGPSRTSFNMCGERCRATSRSRPRCNSSARDKTTARPAS